jgi:hypothetical protein
VAFFAHFDDGDGNLFSAGQIGTIKGYSDFCRWAEKLDPRQFPQVVHLREHGVCSRLDDLERQLRLALDQFPTGRIARAVAEALLLILPLDGPGGRRPGTGGVSVRMDEYNSDEADEPDEDNVPEDWDTASETWLEYKTRKGLDRGWYARRLRECRTAGGLGVEQLARRAGLDAQDLQEIEAGRLWPDWSQLTALSRSLRLTYGEFIAPLASRTGEEG